MIKGLKNHLFNKRLKEATQRIKAGDKPQQNSFKNVLLFFDGTDGAERKVIQKYANELANFGSIVKQFAFINTSQSDTDIGIDHYVTKDINWYQVPKSEDLEIIQGKSYDVMISLFSQLNPHHLFVIQSVKAAMKIGPQIDNNQEFIFDISVDHESSLGIPELIKNIKSSIQLLSNGK